MLRSFRVMTETGASCSPFENQILIMWSVMRAGRVNINVLRLRRLVSQSVNIRAKTEAESD